MKKLTYYIAFALIFILAACSREQQPSGPVLATVNGYELTCKEFHELLAKDMRMEEDYKLTREAREQFLDDLITKQTLIQEAKRLKLDSEEKFVKSVQRFWESTLIRDLIEAKSQEIDETTLVTEEELQVRYAAMLAQDSRIGNYENMRGEILETVLDEKKAALLARWIEDLRLRCNVEINEALLSAGAEGI